MPVMFRAALNFAEGAIIFRFFYLSFLTGDFENFENFENFEIQLLNVFRKLVNGSYLLKMGRICLKWVVLAVNGSYWQ